MNAHKVRATTVSIFLFLRKAKRSINPANVLILATALKDAGYVTHEKNALRITEAGKQALNDIDKNFKQARYSYIKKKLKIQATTKPKTII